MIMDLVRENLKFLYLHNAESSLKGDRPEQVETVAMPGKQTNIFSSEPVERASAEARNTDT